MSAFNASRREVLGAATMLLGMAVSSPALAFHSGQSASFILDARLPEAAALSARARQAGHRMADPQGEILRLLLGPQGRLLIGADTIIGLSTYTDFMLAGDVLRAAGRRPRGALALPLVPGKACEPLLTLLHEACRRRVPSLATSYLWLA